MYKTKQHTKDDDAIIIEPLKPRNKHLNDVLLSRPGGRMKSPKDHSRQKEKQELRRLSFED
jgi:hypothetical protein